MKNRLRTLYFLQFGVWGCYLSSLGQLLGAGGLGADIPWFYAAVGLVSLLTPALAGHIADICRSPRRVLVACHTGAATMMSLCWLYCSTHTEFGFAPLFVRYVIFLALYMPTVALANTTTFGLLKADGLRPVDAFPSIRIWGTIGFVAAMWLVNSAWSDGGSFGFTLSDTDPHSRMRFQYTSMQLLAAGIFGFATALYALTLPELRDTEKFSEKRVTDWKEIFGLHAFSLFRLRDVRTFLLLAVLAGVCLQISNGYVVPFINHFMGDTEYAGSAVAANATMLFSLSQISEAACILLVGIAMKRMGIRWVVCAAMLAWSLRFLFLGTGNPGDGLAWLVLSMLVYGIAFNFFTVAAHIWMESRCDSGRKGFGQGLVMMMSNGIGATAGIIGAGEIVNRYCHWEMVAAPGGGMMRLFMGDWIAPWMIFAAYALLVGILFVVLFRPARS